MTFWRKAFSRASAIKTMSSLGCRKRQIFLAKWSLFGTLKYGSSIYLVVYVAVGKHGVEVLDTFLGIPVEAVLKPFLDCSHVHRSFDY